LKKRLDKPNPLRYTVIMIKETQTRKAETMKVEVTIRRPNGQIETITHPNISFMTAPMWEAMKKAMLAANKGECLSFQNIIPQLSKSETERSRISKMFRRAADLMHGSDTNPAAGIELEKKARAELAEWRESFPEAAIQEDADAAAERARREERKALVSEALTLGQFWN
jgi:hypothetical protein